LRRCFGDGLRDLRAFDSPQVFEFGAHAGCTSGGAVLRTLRLGWSPSAHDFPLPSLRSGSRIVRRGIRNLIP
jgi:hypothetical protein